MRLISSFTSKATVALASALLCSAATALLACAPAFATGPATVTVRVEGATQTLVPATGVTTTPEPVSGDGNPAHSCPGSSALGALALASGGQWTGTWYESFHAWAVESVMGESHTFESGSSAPNRGPSATHGPVSVFGAVTPAVAVTVIEPTVATPQP